MSEEKEKKKHRERDAEEIKEILGTVSKEIPALIKSIIGSVFSEEAGRDMGKGAAAFYKELKDAGMPEEVAVKMTENYISVFTNLGDILKNVGKEGKMTISPGRIALSPKEEEEIGEEISRKIKEKLAKKYREREEDEE